MHTTNLNEIRAQVREDIALCLNGKLKAFLNKVEVEATGAATASALEDWARKNSGPLLPNRFGKYRLSAVVELGAAQRIYGQRRISERKLRAVTANLAKANEKRLANAI